MKHYTSIIHRNIIHNIWIMGQCENLCGDEAVVPVVPRCHLSMDANL